MSGPLGEFGRIARLLAPLTEGCPGALSLKDDGATLTPPPGWEIAATKDMLVEGVHFLPGDAPRDLARKMLRVNLSDLASMGAKPWTWLLSFALPKRCDDAWVEAFVSGLAEDQAAFGMVLAGGDSVSTPGPIVLDAVLLGLVETGQALRRTGAKPGDDVWLSGTLGDAALGLMAAKGELTGLAFAEQDYLIRRFQVPEPRISLGRALIGRASAAMDVSDGLIADARKLAASSGLAVEISAPLLPLSEAAAEAVALDAALFARILTGGDDYELLFTAPQAMRPHILSAARELSVPAVLIGSARSGEGVLLRDKDGAILDLGDTGGWVHG